MSESDNYLKILEKMSEISSNVSVLANEVSHINTDLQEMKRDMSEVKAQDIEQNRLLDQHILGVKTAMNRVEQEKEARIQERQLQDARIAEIESRLKKAEFVPNLLSNLKTAVIWIAGLLAAVGTIGKFFKWF